MNEQIRPTYSACLQGWQTGATGGRELHNQPELMLDMTDPESGCLGSEPRADKPKLWQERQDSSVSGTITVQTPSVYMSSVLHASPADVYGQVYCIISSLLVVKSFIPTKN